MEKAVKDGLQVPSLPSVHTLPQDFVEEALILSDILELNEISSVELLLAGEQQLPRYVMVYSWEIFVCKMIVLVDKYRCIITEFFFFV